MYKRQTVRKQIGKTTYIVRVHFSETAKETMEDKIKRMTVSYTHLVLVLLLDIAIIVSEAKMEFRLSSMEISLKKVLGYSFYERHKRVISVNLIENIAEMCIRDRIKKKPHRKRTLWRLPSIMP